MSTLSAINLKHPSSGSNNIVLDSSGNATVAGTLTATTGLSIPDSTITTAMIAAAAVTPAKLSQPLTLATAQNTTSGTSIDFTGIPSWVRRITVMLNGVSTNGTSNPMIQLGTSSGVTTSGYLGNAKLTNAATGTSFTTGFGLAEANAAGNIYYGIAVITNISGDAWVYAASNGRSDSAVSYSGNGGVSLAATLDRIRLTTVNGTDAFDAGSVNIMYEG